MIDTYIDANTKIRHRCLKHDTIFETTPTRALEGVGCEQCKKEKFRNARKKSEEQFIEELHKISPFIDLASPYVTARTPSLFFCHKHNVEWKATPDNLLKGCGCPQCGNEKSSKANQKSNEQYLLDVAKKNPNIEPLEKYKGAFVPILHQCLLDGYKWEVAPAYVLGGCECPECNKFGSKGERQIKKWLEENNIYYIFQKTFPDCKSIRLLSFDFYLPSKNLCIEYDGAQHFKPIDYFGGEKELEYVQMHDNLKTEYCEKKGIKLLRISYNENIEEKLNNFLFN